MNNSRLSIPEEKVLDGVDFGWLYRLINMKLSDHALSQQEQNELRRLSVKMYALDTATATRRRAS